MLANSIFQTIETKYSRFTKSEKIVADFLFEYPEKVLYTSITELAELCGVGDTTVFRFCKALNLNGYQEFKMLLAQELAVRNGQEDSIVGTISGEDDVRSICKKTLMTNIAALNETYEVVDYSEVERAAELIAGARRIHFFGIGSSGITALAARQKFMRILPNVDFVTDCHMQYMASSLLGHSDVAIFFSYSGSSKDTIEIHNIAKKNGCKTICITRYQKSVLASKADVVLRCGSNEGPLDGGALATTMVQLYILDVLYLQYFIKHYQQSKENKARTTESISSKLL